MSFNKDLLESLIEYNAEKSPDFVLHLDGKTYSVNNSVISNSSIPVNEPTTRGGVYFSDKFAYKMTGVIDDLSVVPLLTGKMLGPNTEFGELRISTAMEYKGAMSALEISTNLTNSVQTPNSIELSMIIVKIEQV